MNVSESKFIRELRTWYIQVINVIGSRLSGGMYMWLLYVNKILSGV
jgi:hypothetical protein